MYFSEYQGFTNGNNCNKLIPLQVIQIVLAVMPTVWLMITEIQLIKRYKREQMYYTDEQQDPLIQYTKKDEKPSKI